MTAVIRVMQLVHERRATASWHVDLQRRFTFLVETSAFKQATVELPDGTRLGGCANGVHEPCDGRVGTLLLRGDDVGALTMHINDFGIILSGGCVGRGRFRQWG